METYQTQMPEEPGKQKPAMPNNYLALSIITTVLCCVPLGIVAVIKSSKVESLYLTGHYEEAKKASEDAKKWSIIGILLSVIGVGLYIFLLVVIGITDGFKDF